MISHPKTNTVRIETISMEETTMITKSQSTEFSIANTSVLHFDFNQVIGETFTTTDGCHTGTCHNLTVKDTVDGKGLYFDSEKGHCFSLGKGKVASLCPDGRFTVSMWVRGENTRDRTLRFLSLYDDAGEYLGVYYSNHRLHLWITDHHTNRHWNYSFFYTIAAGGNDDSWQFLSLTVDRTTLDVSLFVNGHPITNYQYSDLWNGATDTQYEDTIGGDIADQIAGMTGYIANFYLHNRILTADERKELYLSQPKHGIDMDSLFYSEQLSALTDLLGNGAILKVGTSNIVHRGYVIKADTENYHAVNLLINGVLHVPASFATRYFGVVVLQNNTASLGEKLLTGTVNNGVLYFSLPALCEIRGFSVIDLTAEASELLVICSDDTSLSLQTHRALIENAEPFCVERKGEPTINVEQTRRVIMYSDKSTGEWVYSPAILKVANILYASMDASDGLYTAIYRSLDEGETWEFLSKIEKYYFWANLFEINGTLYLFGTYSTDWTWPRDDGRTIDYYIGVTRSTDGGYTWEPMTEGNGLISYKNTIPHRGPTACLKHDGKVYFVFEYGCRPVLCWAEERSDLMKPESWTFAPFDRSLHNISYAIEGNPVLGRDGRIYVLSRTSVADTAFLSVLNESGTALEPVDYLPMDGGHHKFTVYYDEKTGKYLSVSNYTAVADPAFKQQRLNLVLVSSKDLLHWKVEQFLLADRQVIDWRHSVYQNGFQYVDWIIDGDDLLMAVREARENAKNYHDANYLTFYRIKNYAQYID